MLRDSFDIFKQLRICLFPFFFLVLATYLEVRDEALTLRRTGREKGGVIYL
jgi:hypothetical protein